MNRTARFALVASTIAGAALAAPLTAQAAMLAAPEVARILAEELGHDAAWQQRTLQDLATVAATYRLK